MQALCWDGREAQLLAAAPGSGSLLVLRPGAPVPHPTDVAVAGHRLYVTTARQPVPLDILANAPLSGRLLTVSI